MRTLCAAVWRPLGARMRMRTPAQPSTADTFLNLCLVLNEVHMRTVKQLYKRLVRALHGDDDRPVTLQQLT